MYRNVMNKRIYVVIVMFILLFTAIIIKLGHITFFESNKINLLAYDLWSREIPVSTSRGLILDRNGEIIVGNELCYTVCSINRQIDDKNKTALILANILGCSKDSIYKHITKNNSIEIIKPEGRRITIEKALEISKANLDGIYITYDSKRYYPYGNMLGSVLGFCGIDMEGLSGVEYMYNDYLKGQNGSLSIYTDAKGNLMHDMITEYNNSTPGMNVYLTIDIELQKIMDGVIKKAIEMYNPQQVMGLMISAKTGEVLAMTSYPFFEPSNYQSYDPSIYNRILPIFNQFELGSTFKIITYAAALEEGLFDLNDHIYCGGSSVVADRKIRCWKSGGHGSQTMLEGIQNSCNVCFMNLGQRLGVERFYEYLEKFGMMKKTGIDLQGEGTPIIVKKDNCGPVELATQAFGQSSAYTPIQLSMAAIASVNGGDLLKPYILKSLETFTGDIVYEKQKTITKEVISDRTSNLMKYALECVCALGSGRNAFVEGYRVGGKTGTAQVISSTGGYEPGHYILSFLGMAPMNDPEILCYLAIDKPQNCVQYGGTVAAPLVGEIMEQSLTYLGIERDYENQIEKNLRWFLDTPTYKVDNYIGKTKKEIKNTQFYNYVYYGDGDTVIYQSPDQGEKIKEGDTIMLYMG
ncbi:MAG: hypothetical protein IJA65_00645 [Acholeplasmatales bacterium]|nr:hypothetical protein [Acholeplasmatales bacterium]